MKRLLLLLPLLLTPAAHAVDYVKCEAIQSAAARVRVSMEDQVSAAGSRASNLFFIENCGAPMAELLATSGVKELSERQKELLACNSATYKQSRVKVVEAQAAERMKVNARLAKIQADYEAAGCY